MDSDGLSRDSSVVEAYVNDPLVYTGKATARLGAELIKAMQNVTLQAANINLPIMIAQGSDDKLVDPGGAQLLYDLIVIGQLLFKKNQEKWVTLFPFDFGFKNSVKYSQILFFSSALS